MSQIENNFMAAPGRWNGPRPVDRTPMTPTQLDELRPKPAAQRPVASTAKQVAYQTGIRELEPLVLRIESLEALVRQLQADIVELKYPIMHASRQGRDNDVQEGSGEAVRIAAAPRTVPA